MAPADRGNERTALRLCPYDDAFRAALDALFVSCLTDLHLIDRINSPKDFDLPFLFFSPPSSRSRRRQAQSAKRLAGAIKQEQRGLATFAQVRSVLLSAMRSDEGDAVFRNAVGIILYIYGV